VVAKQSAKDGVPVTKTLCHARHSAGVMVLVSVYTLLITDRWTMMTVMQSECVYANCLTLLISFLFNWSESIWWP